MLRINDVTQIWLGIQGENLARNIEIDVSDWVEDFPDAGFSVWMTAPGGTVPQATGASYDTENQKLVWSPSSTDTYVAGEGEAEIRLSEGNVVKKTKKIRVGVSGSVTSGGTTLGADWQEYIDEADRIRALAVAAQLAAEQAQDAAENVAEHPPYINLGTYRWMVWNRTEGAYEDSGISAQGVPGPAGSQGPQGIQGERGPQGPQGIQGVQGVQGQTGPAGQAGPAGERGEAFKITKTYSSIAAMEADYSSQDVDYEDFVIIQTVQGQTDNGKVYKKGTTAWEFIVQMAGVEGPAGPTGPQGPQGIQGIQGETGATGPQGPQGIQGIQGVPGPGVPTGGTAGQYLRKNSGTDYDADWESPVNGLTETAAGKVLDARQGKVLDDRASAIQDGLAIVTDGNTHAAIASGQFVYVKNHASLAEGLYKATAAIGTNAALTTSNLTADGSGGLNNLQAQVTTLNSNIVSKEWTPANNDSLLTWLLANISDRTKLPFSFIKKGTSAKVSDVPLGASQEFSGIVEGYGDRLNVTLTMYIGRRRFYRSIWQNSWQGTNWYPVDVKDVHDFTLASGESQIVSPQPDSSGLMIIKGQGSNIEYTSIRGYSYINQYANNVGSTIYEYNYNNGASISVASESTGIKITNNSSRSATFKVLFIHAYS